MENCGDGSTQRLFIAIGIPDGVLASLANTQRRLCEQVGHLRTPPRDRMHLTVAFLGDILVVDLPGVVEALDAVAAGSAPFAMRIAGCGSFGPIRAPRVVWAGVESCPALHRLEAGLREVLLEMRLPMDKRPYAPHVTLARCTPGTDARALTSVLRSFRHEAFGKVDVDRILLMRSVLDQDPPRHLVLHESFLKGSCSHGSKTPVEGR